MGHSFSNQRVVGIQVFLFFLIPWWFSSSNLILKVGSNVLWESCWTLNPLVDRVDDAWLMINRYTFRNTCDDNCAWIYYYFSKFSYMAHWFLDSIIGISQRICYICVYAYALYFCGKLGCLRFTYNNLICIFMAVSYYILWRCEWNEVEDIETFPPSVIQSPSMLYKFQDTMNSTDL